MPMKTFLFTISGMTCHSCEALITLDLEDAGLPKPKEIHSHNGSMLIELNEYQVDDVKAVIEKSHKYNVESIKLYEQ